MSDEFIVVKAGLKDAGIIQKLIQGYAKKNQMLPRSLGDIYADIREYFVCRHEGKVVGCVALHVYWKDLAEVRALAVSKKYSGKGIGTKLVNACVIEAQQLKLPRIFSLTLIPKFFKKLGFKPIEKSELPMKIWSDCIRCPKFASCDEFALVKELK